MLAWWKARIRTYGTWATLFVILALKVLEASLTLPSGFDIQDFRGFVRDDAVDAAVNIWRSSGRSSIAYVYSLVDLVIFIPLYTSLMFRVADRIDDYLRPQQSSPRTLLQHHPLSLLWMLLAIALALTDIAEGSIGIYKLTSGEHPAAGLLGLLLSLTVLIVILAFDDSRKKDRTSIAVLSVVIALLLLALLRFGSFDACHAHSLARTVYAEGCVAQFLVLKVFGWPFAVLAASAALEWHWGAGLNSHDFAERSKRFQLLAAIGAIMVRCRYILVFQLLLGALLFFGDQTRDVLVGMALADPVRGETIFAVSIWALWTFSHACWLWTNVACRVPDPDPASIAASPNVYIETFARNWARFMGLVPIGLFAALAGGALQALAASASHAGSDLSGAFWSMLWWALIAIAAGLVFILKREYHAKRLRQEGANPRYFNDPSVIENGNVRLTGRAWQDRRYGFWLIFGNAPAWLPVASLLAMILARCLDAAGIAKPLAFPCLLFALSAWLGFLSWLAHLERRQSLPWGLLLAVIVGVLSWKDWITNHAIWAVVGPTRQTGHAAEWICVAAILVGAIGLFMSSRRSDVHSSWRSIRQDVVAQQPAMPAVVGVVFFVVALIGLAAIAIGTQPGPWQVPSLAALQIRAQFPPIFLVWIFSALIAIVLAMAGSWAIWQAPYASRLAVASALVLFCGAVFGVMAWADDTLGRRADQLTNGRAPGTPADVLTEDETPISIDAALAEWIDALSKATGGDVLTASHRLPVYFISSEGGGARAAYWTGAVLSELEKKGSMPGGPGVLDRSFSVSGVSGGSVGAAAWDACERAYGPAKAQHTPGTSPADKCLEQFGKTDLTTPLLGAWVFEDVIGSILPTVWCTVPGCGFLSRGIWFERRLDGDVPEMSAYMRQPRRKRPQDVQPDLQNWRPHLFLNSTWVESGERAVASDIGIASADGEALMFPTARDTIDVIGPITLATAAHNSARFPFINAIGLAKSRSADKCPGKATPFERAPFDCGHIVDGGYFENSGSQTSIDIVHALHRLLTSESIPLGYEGKQEQWRSLQAWAKRTLAPTAIFIRNGVKLLPGPSKRADADAAAVECVRRASKDDPTDLLYRNPNNAYGDVVGIADAAVSSLGFGSQQRRAEVLLAEDIRILRQAIGADVAQEKWTFNIDQVDDGPLYPLGWYLSDAARTRMSEQAAKSVSLFMDESTSHAAPSGSGSRKRLSDCQINALEAAHG